jgi:hypothetical protein
MSFRIYKLTKSNIADTKDTHNANNDQIDGNNIIEQFWLNENEYAGKQGYNRSEGQIHGVSFAGSDVVCGEYAANGLPTQSAVGPHVGYMKETNSAFFSRHSTLHCKVLDTNVCCHHSAPP